MPCRPISRCLTKQAQSSRQPGLACFAHASGYAEENHGVGMNYLAVCEAAAAVSQDAARTAAALRDIMEGTRSEFRMEYPCRSPQGPRWFQLRATRPDQAQTCRIVIAHEDITEVKRTHEELARLSGRLMHLQDEERRAIARELHDTTAQNLLAITLNTTRLQEGLRDAGEPARRTLMETLELAEQSLQEVRTLSYLLHPPLLDDIGLTAALSWLARGFSQRSGIQVDISIENNGEPLPSPLPPPSTGSPRRRCRTFTVTRAASGHGLLCTEPRIWFSSTL